MFGWGWRRWAVAAAYGDPTRAYFGLGPCGELAYQMYRSGDVSTLRAEIEALKKRIEELERELEELRKKS